MRMKLKHVDAVKYLGVQMSYDLRWDKHIDYITSKANDRPRQSVAEFMHESIESGQQRKEEEEGGVRVGSGRDLRPKKRARSASVCVCVRVCVW